MNVYAHPIVWNVNHRSSEHIILSLCSFLSCSDNNTIVDDDTVCLPAMLIISVQQ